MIRRPPRSTRKESSAASDVYKRQGLAWLDSDGKENGEWSIIGIKPKKTILSRDINNLDKANNPFNNLKNIEKGFWIGWLSYEAGVYIEPKNPWRKSNMATLWIASYDPCLLYTSPSPRDLSTSRMPSSA